jgi:hypothetical protein
MHAFVSPLEHSIVTSDRVWFNAHPERRFRERVYVAGELFPQIGSIGQTLFGDFGEINTVIVERVAGLLIRRAFFTPHGVFNYLNTDDVIRGFLLLNAGIQPNSLLWTGGM